MKMIRNSTFKIPIVHVLTDTLPLFFSIFGYCCHPL